MSGRHLQWWTSVTIVLATVLGSHEIVSESQEFGPRCLNCQGVENVQDCHDTAECWPHEICYSEKVLNSSGAEWFNFGCKTQEACKAIESTSSGKSRRFDIELRTCQKCCNGSLCNYHACHEEEYTTPCFSCIAASDAQRCEGFVLCDPGQSCYAEKYLQHGLHPLYNLGCAPQLICDAINAGIDTKLHTHSKRRESVDVRATYLCQKCCTEQGCNAKVCDEHHTTTPPLTVLTTESIAGNTTGDILPENTTVNFTTSHTTVGPPTTSPIPVAKDCWELRQVHNVTVDGEYLLHTPNRNGTVAAWCDMTTDSGGWVVFQRREFGNVSFNRNWTEFENGFGDISHAFWWGNQHLYEFTQDEPIVMRIDLTDADGDKLFAEYGNFSLTNSSDSYRLLLGGYRGSVGKLMYFFKHPNEVGSRHAGQQFTTKDVDRDKWGGNCASYTGGGFWLDECCIACLNGKYRQINGNLCMGSVIGDIVLHCVQRTEMKFRPASAMSLTPGNYTEPPPHSSKQ